MAGLIAASGYESLLNRTPLSLGAVYGGTIVDRNYEEDLLYHITNSSVLADLTTCGQVIEFVKPPRVGAWRPYEMNTHLIFDQPSSEGFSISICGSSYKAIKVDKDDIRRMCDHWAEYEAAFLEDAWNNLSMLWHNYALSGMQLQLSNRNFGNNAGRYQNINLGSVGNPLHLDVNNILSFFARMRDVLTDNGRWYEGQMFMVAPRAMETLLLETMFAKQMCCNTQDSVLFKGMKARDIMGFTLAVSDRLKPTVDPTTRRLIYPIIAGWTEAYAFVGDVVDAQIDPLSGSFGIGYSMKSVYGGGVIYPEALCKAYASFENNGTVAP